MAVASEESLDCRAALTAPTRQPLSTCSWAQQYRSHHQQAYRWPRPSLDRKCGLLEKHVGAGVPELDHRGSLVASHRRIQALLGDDKDLTRRRGWVGETSYLI